MHKKVKDSVDSVIGDKPIFTEKMQEEVLQNMNNDRRRKEKRFNRNRLLPVLGFVAFIMIGSLLLQDVYHLNEAENEPKDEEPNVVSSDAGVDNDANKKDWDLEAIREAESKRLKEYAEKLEKEKAELLDEVSLLEYKVDNAQPSTTIYYNTDATLEFLGYEGTSEDIIQEVLKDNDVIPYDGILGGTMRFHPEGIYVLSHKHVYAEFDDGHTGGYVIMEYEIIDGELTNLTVLDSYILGDENKE